MRKAEDRAYHMAFLGIFLCPVVNTKYGADDDCSPSIRTVEKDRQTYTHQKHVSRFLGTMLKCGSFVCIIISLQFAIFSIFSFLL